MIDRDSVKKYLCLATVLSLTVILIMFLAEEDKDCSTNEAWEKDLLFNNNHYIPWLKSSSPNPGDEPPLSEILLSAWYQLMTNMTDIKAIIPGVSEALFINGQRTVLSLDQFTEKETAISAQTAHAPIGSDVLKTVNLCSLIKDVPTHMSPIEFQFFSERQNSSAIVEAFFSDIVKQIIKYYHIGSNLEKDRSHTLLSLLILVPTCCLARIAQCAYWRNDDAFTGEKAEETSHLIPKEAVIAVASSHA